MKENKSSLLSQVGKRLLAPGGELQAFLHLGAWKKIIKFFSLSFLLSTSPSLLPPMCQVTWIGSPLEVKVAKDWPSPPRTRFLLTCIQQGLGALQREGGSFMAAS